MKKDLGVREFNVKKKIHCNLIVGNNKLINLNDIQSS